MRAPRVYTAITAVASELAAQGISKGQINSDDGYRFRGIDDIYNALSPLLARHKLCILPRVLERHCTERRAARGETMFCVTVKAAFDFVSAQDGSQHMIETWGEALDSSDKATSKAMSAAYKYAAMQAFCIPIEGSEDPDSTSTRINAVDSAEPVQGWEQWTADIIDMATSCITEEALARVQDTYRTQLRALSTARCELYAQIGVAIQARREAVTKPPLPESAPPPQQARLKLNGGEANATAATAQE